MPSCERAGSLLLPALLCAIIGCSGSKIEPPNENSKPTKSSGVVRILVIDDEPLAQTIEREWRARDEREIEVKNATSVEVVGKKSLTADAVIYPAGLLGELAEGELIVPVPEDVLADKQLARKDLLPLSRQPEVAWGSKVYGLAFGSPQLVLLYRADLFEKLQLSPPVSWSVYQNLADKLSDRAALGDLAPPQESPWWGTCEPLGPGWASQTLLARAAGYARHPNQYSALFDLQTMEPLVAGPPFVKALEELVATAKLAPANANSFSPHDARREFLSGRCAMALAWPTGSRSEHAESKTPITAGAAELPGSREYFDLGEAKWHERPAEDAGRVPLLAASGRLGSVTKESRRARAAFNVLIWLSGEEWSAQIASQSRETSFYRSSHAAAPEAWVDAGLGPEAVGQYGKAVVDANDRSVWLSSVRIPGRARYLAALDKAVHAAVAGEKSAGEALQAAADEWRGINQELGVEKQRLAYQRSLGIDP